MQTKEHKYQKEHLACILENYLLKFIEIILLITPCSKLLKGSSLPITTY